METSVSVRLSKNGKFTADIHIDGIDVMELRSLDNEWLRNLVRAQVAAYLRFKEGVSDPKKLDEYVRAIVDGTPLPQSSSPKDKSVGQDSSDADKPPHTEEGN